MTPEEYKLVKDKLLIAIKAGPYSDALQSIFALCQLEQVKLKEKELEYYYENFLE